MDRSEIEKLVKELGNNPEGGVDPDDVVDLILRLLNERE